jgi:primosomal protein N' (replication factor Y)
MSLRLRIAVETPQHSGLAGALDYASDQALAPGTLVRVPLGRREVCGVVWDPADEPAPTDAGWAVKPVAAVLGGLPPLGPSWRRLVSFAAGYYQRGLGELALAVLPPELRLLDDAALERRRRRKRRAATAVEADRPPPLNPEQAAAVAAIASALSAGDGLATTQPPPLLLHGVTGSGKTEVYLHAAAQALAAGRQVLVLVPEINLTPQLTERLARRFADRRLVTLHSGLTPAQRLQHWLAAHTGEADLVLGTRLAIFASMPRLGLIVVDEEHDPSYKQQEGARYSARDLAVWRAQSERLPVVLGSATPSLETWQRADEGRYRRLTLAARVGAAALPRVRLVDWNQCPKPKGPPSAIAPPLLDALRLRLQRGEQSLLLLNRRGYAPVLHCTSCGWKSGCPHCSAWQVFHKAERVLRCHHCAAAARVPQACPQCGDLDLHAMGRGTERLEEQLAELLPGARIGRIDADSTRAKGELQARLQAVHAGEVDVLVGTQMVAKGHDFRRMTLVAAVNPDGALFSSDFRAPERLFALLMQAAGRAGRDAAMGPSEMWLQTWHPQHALYAALRDHDYPRFAATQLADRRSAGLPPFASLALLRADARDGAVAEAFLTEAGRQAEARAAEAGAALIAYPAVAPPISRVADTERRQLLLESPSRAALQHVLRAALPDWHALRSQHRGLARWAVDVDPLAI